MKRRGFLKTALGAVSITARGSLYGMPAETNVVECGDLKATVGPDGFPIRIQSGSGGSERVWLESIPTLSVTNEVTGVSDSPTGGQIKALGLGVTSKWLSSQYGLIWDLSFTGPGKRTGHEVTIDLPVLSPGIKIFTPSNDPEFLVSARPTYRPVNYAHMGWGYGLCLRASPYHPPGPQDRSGSYGGAATQRQHSASSV